MAVTGTEEERARFVLETAGWDLQVAPRGGAPPVPRRRLHADCRSAQSLANTASPPENGGPEKQAGTKLHQA